jgi:hypothetical protein
VSLHDWIETVVSVVLFVGYCWLLRSIPDIDMESTYPLR